jgi:hypothetical protein
VLDQMPTLLHATSAEPHGDRMFLASYERTTRAVHRAIDGALFEDPAWVHEWDVVFADL